VVSDCASNFFMRRRRSADTDNVRLDLCHHFIITSKDSPRLACWGDDTEFLWINIGHGNLVYQRILFVTVKMACRLNPFFF
jgi:hypothetical protein